MSDNSLDIWLGAWSRASGSVSVPLLGAPGESADRAFGLLARARATGDSSSLNEADPDALSRDCALLAAPIRNVRPGFVKTLCFTTKGPQLSRLLLSIVFMQILARLNDYEGPIAWLSFPTFMLNDSFFNLISSALSAIQSVAQPLGKPVDWAFEPLDGSQPEPRGTPPTIYLGGSYPFSADPDPSPDAFESQYGLPMICIPSRATEGMTVQLSPTPLVPAVNA